MSAVGVLVDVGKSTTAIGQDLISIEFDATLSESHEWSNDVTTNPVEIGSDITDNIRQQPKRLTISGVVSNSAISDSQMEKISQSGTGSVDGAPQRTRIDIVFDLLQELMKNANLVTVFTRYLVYTDMAITGVNIPREQSTGESLQITVQFLKVRLVETQTVDVPAGISKKLDAKAGDGVKKKTQPQKKAGAQQPDDEAARLAQRYPKPSSSVASNIVPDKIKKILNPLIGR